MVITSLFEEDLPLLELGRGRGGGGVADTTYLMNITDKILLALKYELTQYSCQLPRVSIVR